MHYHQVARPWTEIDPRDPLPREMLLGVRWHDELAL